MPVILLATIYIRKVRTHSQLLQVDGKGHTHLIKEESLLGLHWSKTQCIWLVPPQSAQKKITYLSIISTPTTLHHIFDIFRLCITQSIMLKFFFQILIDAFKHQSGYLLMLWYHQEAFVNRFCILQWQHLLLMWTINYQIVLPCKGIQYYQWLQSVIIVIVTELYIVDTCSFQMLTSHSYSLGSSFFSTSSFTIFFTTFFSNRWENGPWPA